LKFLYAVLLIVLRTATRTATGARAFGAVALKIWSELPELIRSSASLPSFKKSLKTFLYSQAFSS